MTRKRHSRRWWLALAAFLSMVALSAGSTAGPVRAAAPITVSGTLTLNGSPAPIGTVVEFGPGRSSCATLSGSPTTVAGQYSLTLDCFAIGPTFSTADTFINGEITPTRVCLRAGDTLTGVNLAYPAGGSASQVCVPTISQVSPPSGPTTGGTVVTLTGTNFANGTTIDMKAQVLIDGVEVDKDDVTVPDENHITFITPPHIDDVVNITVQNPGLAFIEKAHANNAFTFGTPSGGTVQFNSVTYVGAEAGPLTVNIAISRIGGYAGVATATCSVVAGGAATAPEDFSLTTSTVTWQDGESTNKNCVATLINDALVEGPESANLQLSGPTGSATLGAQVNATLSITDNDFAGVGGQVAFQSATYSGAEGSTFVNVAITRTGGSTGAASATCAVAAGGSATVITDFSISSPTVNWSSGDSANKNCILSIVNDQLIEGPETVNLTLTAGGAATLGAQTTAEFTIVDNDSGGTVQFGAPAYTGAEGGSLVSVQVTRTGGTAGAANATCHIEPTSTATLASDFTMSPVSGLVSWGSGDGSTKLCMVTIINDTVFEGPETIDFSLTAGGTATLGAQTTTTVTINDNDVAGAGGTVQFAAATYNAVEGGGIATIGVTRTGGSVGIATATCSVAAGGTATQGSDFNMTAASVTWFSGDTATKNCTISIINDVIGEPSETINLTLTGPTGSATLGALVSAVVTIQDNDGGGGSGGTLQFSQPAASFSEGAGTVQLTVTRTGGSTGAASATCALAAGGSASAGDATLANPVTLSWAAGDSAAKHCQISIVDDAEDESDETVVVTLTGPFGTAAPGAVSSATVTITDNDDAPPPPGGIDVIAGSTGAIWTGTARNSAGFEADFPAEVTAVYQWNNNGQRFDFWFRGFPSLFNTLAGVEPGGFYFFQAGAVATITVPGAGAYTVPTPGGNFTTSEGATGVVWSGSGIALDDLGSQLPATISAVFEWSTATQGFQFWFAGFPNAFNSLAEGVRHGRYYFFQAPAGVVVPTP